MDKYQKYFFSLYSDLHYELFNCQVVDSKGIIEKGKYQRFNTELDTLTIIQDEDITKTQYSLTICGFGTMGEGYVILEGVEILKNGKWIKLNCKNHLYTTIIDFNHRIEKIKFAFKNQLADDYIVDVIYQEADKDKYNEKLANERKEELLKVANIKVSTGADLVNIYFQPCCNEYARTEIALYKENMLLAKYKVDEETFFKSINGLAFGKYEFVLKQLDKDNNIILETQKIPFSINAPNYGGKPTVWINR